MNYLDSTKSVIAILSGLVGLAFTLGFLFLIWGVFNGFDWDLQLFLTKVGGFAAVICALGYGVYLYANRNKQEPEDS